MDDKIDKLKTKIKNLEKCKITHSINNFKLIYQKNKDNKLYSALFFDSDYDNELSNKELKPFITLNSKSKFVINYSITLDILNPNDLQCSFMLGTKDYKKFKIIKGSKTICDSSQIINNQIIINNTILYETLKKDDVFMITSIDENKVRINEEKSILKYYCM